MHAIVNHLQIRPDAEWSELAGKFDAFNKAIDQSGFRRRLPDPDR